MATFEDIMRGRVDLSRLEESRGWLGSSRDPGADPPDMAGVRLPPIRVLRDRAREEQ